MKEKDIKSIIVGIIMQECFNTSLTYEDSVKSVKTSEEIMEFLKRIELIK